MISRAVIFSVSDRLVPVVHDSLRNLRGHSAVNVAETDQQVSADWGLVQQAARCGGNGLYKPARSVLTEQIDSA